MPPELKPFEDPAVKAAFDAFPANLRTELLHLRELIFETANQTANVGCLLETIKWGQPAYLPSRPRVGSTIRIGTARNEPNCYAMFFHCQTTLVENFRARYPHEFRFQGNRALLFPRDELPATDALKHCIAQALTYHLKPEGSVGAET